MTEIAILDCLSLPPSFALSLPDHEHELHSFDNTLTEQAAAHIGSAEVAVLSKVPITAETLERCPNLKHIAVAATGFNIVNIAACEERDISVSHIPSYAATTVAEHVLACALILRRQILDARQRVIAGKWQASEGFCLFGKPFGNLEGATMGIVGLGEIGTKTAELIRPFGVEVIYAARQKKKHWAKHVELNELLQKSDIISLHCSLNDSTQDLIGKAELELMKPTAILINTARGGLVDEAALVSRVKAERIAGIAFDVLAEEPPKAGSPLIEIAALSSVIITPHCSWTSEQALQHLSSTLNNNVAAYLKGKRKNLVTRRLP